MMIFISCAKTMASQTKVSVPYTSKPTFETEAKQNAMHMAQFSSNELENLLHINSKLSAENYLRYQNFLSIDNQSLPAILSYTGIVFKRINPQDFSQEDFDYAQHHLFISSFLYGLLRPLDLIRNYRMEGDVRLPERGDITMFDYWEPILTDYFIDEIKKKGGVLFNLASDEMKNLFDWKRVCREVRVISPEFLVHKDGKLKTIVVYTKMCRGEMTRYILKNRIEDPEALKSFEWEGFSFHGTGKDENNLIYTL